MAVFALVDCNNFYVSCERLFNPQLKYQPVIVLSNNDGCIIARSNEAKALGIPMGIPYFKVKALCQRHKVHRYSSNYTLYGDLSQRIMNILKSYIEHVEVYSIDEAFLKLTCFKDPADWLAMSQLVKQTIRQWVGIPVSIGIAPTKVLAKIANQVAKKQTQSHIFILNDIKEKKRILSIFPVSDIWGIGRKWTEKLHMLGIRTAWELSQSPPKLIKKHFNVMVEKIVLELNGVNCHDLETYLPKKSITVSRSFSKAVMQQSDLAEAISCYTVWACEKLRQQHSKASAIKIFILSNYYQENNRFSQSITRQFTIPTDNTLQIIAAAKQGLNHIYNSQVAIKKAGISLLDLSESNQQQTSLFEDYPQLEAEKSALLMQTMDKINKKMGKDTLFVAAQGIERAWQTQRAYCSPCYTTRWDQLLKVQ